MINSNLTSVIAEQDYDSAIKYYSQAIEANPKSAVYFGNRSFAYLKLEWFGYALEDATKAIELDKNYIKGYYRRASAKMSLGKFKEALRDFEIVSICKILLIIFQALLFIQVTKIRPNDKDAKMKFKECDKIVRKLAFEKAIAVEDMKTTIADTINLDAWSKFIQFDMQVQKY